MEQLKGAQGQGLMVFEEGGSSSADQAYQQVRHSTLAEFRKACRAATRSACIEIANALGSGHISSQQACWPVRGDPSARSIAAPGPTGPTWRG